MNHRFVGRRRELELLNQLLEKRVASLVVIKGRRRIGKSRLAEEFGKGMRSLLFTGLPPTPRTTAQKQREHFARLLSRQLGIPLPRADDWSDLFWHLAQGAQEGRVLIILDEITWLGAKDPTFLGKLKTAWDTDFKKNSELILMLTGSISSWIEKNILSSTGFVGRISLNMTLDELPLPVCSQFWGPHEEQVSPFEKFKVLAVTGGVPRYLEEIVSHVNAEENIRRLCFQKEGLLFDEFERIFSDLFLKTVDTYRKIVEILAEGSRELSDICRILGKKKGGTISRYLQDLEMAGFVSRDYTWHLPSRKISKLSRYRLKDNYLRFYLKYIAPNRQRIKLGRYPWHPNQWATIFGLQFENLVLSNRDLLLAAIGINPHQVLFDNPYFQKSTKKHSGCQVDYLIQDRMGSLYLCEIKFSQNPITTSVIKEVKKKIGALSLPKHCSIRPVLIHVGGVSDAVLAEEFFAKIVDFGQLMASANVLDKDLYDL